jgi:hypothetical protein
MHSTLRLIVFLRTEYYRFINHNAPTVLNFNLYNLLKQRTIINKPTPEPDAYHSEISKRVIKQIIDVETMWNQMAACVKKTDWKKTEMLNDPYNYEKNVLWRRTVSYVTESPP